MIIPCGYSNVTDDHPVRLFKRLAILLKALTFCSAFLFVSEHVLKLVGFYSALIADLIFTNRHLRFVLAMDFKLNPLQDEGTARCNAVKSAVCEEREVCSQRQFRKQRTNTTV
jgi:hypothetical protein